MTPYQVGEGIAVRPGDRLSQPGRGGDGRAEQLVSCPGQIFVHERVLARQRVRPGPAMLPLARRRQRRQDGDR